MKNIIFILVLFFGNTAFAQNNCHCEVAIEKLITAIESNYLGFKEKATSNVEIYNNHKTVVLQRSKNRNNQDCIKILTDYTSFFKDEHIYIEQKTENKLQTNEIDTQKKDKPEIEARMLASNIFYVKISSFKYENIDPVKKLIANNKKQIEKSKALIIDVRNNFGGTDDVYQPLLPYILTNPLRIMNVEFLSTPTLINGLREYALQNIAKNTLKNIQQIEDDLKEYKENLGKFILYDGKKVTIDSIQLQLKSPKQIVILSNKNVASAGENFLFSSRQSKKVKILGTPSMGVLDYGSIREFKLECDQYTLYLPTYRSARLPHYPIDNIGIQPDVYLDETVNDWLEFAIKYINE